MAAASVCCHAQSNNKAKEDFDAFRKEMHNDFNDFRADINRRFVEFVRNPWKEFQVTAPVPKPEPKIVPPVVMPKDSILPQKNNPIIIDEVIKPFPISPQPTPIKSIPQTNIINERIIPVSFFGTTCSVKFPQNSTFSIKGTTENDIADALSILTTELYDNLLHDCLNTRTKLHLCDWAYLLFVRNVARTVFDRNTNKATLLAAYIFIQSGYKVRLGVNGNQLYMLYASEHHIFGKPSYYVDGELYYGDDLPATMNISQASFPGEKRLSLQITELPLLAKNMSEDRYIISMAYPVIKTHSQVNKNLLSFYETYPSSYYGDNFMTQWSQYANTPASQELSEQLYPIMRKLVGGMSEYESVQRILNWVQTGFTYGYDNRIWGHDRTFFAEETLFYPCCDCEDRSILFTRLVRDILHLDCILVYCPGHLFTAVHFNTDVKGDYLTLDNKRYIVCDPTYIGAPIGNTMPGTNNDSANIILLNK